MGDMTVGEVLVRGGWVARPGSVDEGRVVFIVMMELFE